MSEPSELWLNLLPIKSTKQKPANWRHDYRQKVLKLLDKRHPDLYSGQTGATLSLDEAKVLISTLQKHTPGEIFKDRVRYLIRGLEKGAQELGWNVAIPEAPLVIPRDKPRFTLEIFYALPVVYAVKAAFIENLKQPPPISYTTRVGQLLLSAILFSGLVRKRWLAPWVEALSSATCEPSQLWLNMVLTPVHLERERRATGVTRKTKPTHSNTREKWEIPQRWFADPLTHALILRWYKEFPKDLHAGRDVSPQLAIRQYLDLILGNPKKTPESFVLALLHGSATRIGLGVPSYLLGYAEEINKSVSLSSEAWERLLTGKCIVTPKRKLNEDIDEVIPVAELLPIPEAQHFTVMANQEKMLKEVLWNILPPSKTFKRKGSESREALQIYHKENHAKMCQSLSCLVLWCIDLLTHYNRQELIRGRVRSRIKALSVHRYLSAIGKRLIAVASDEEILAFESDELHDLYREVIDICPTDKCKNNAGTRLHGFHQFLSIKLGAPAVDFSDLGVKSGPAELGVNANLISCDSFDQMKKALCPNYSKASRMRKMQFFLAIIMFRCGLREMESLKLRIIDLQGNVEPELLVRTNRYAYAKSSESVRRLPLEYLLEEEELKLLLAWRRDRKLEDGISIPESLLFCLDSQPNILLSKYEALLPILQAVRQVTGDANLVLHHFRHSFATWMLLRLLKNFTPEIRQRFHFLNHSQFDHSNCDRLRKAILGNHLLGRQALFATAQLCGHAGPKVTLLHYIHLCDWLLAVELALPDNQPALDATTIEAITGLPRHILYYDKDKQEDTSWHVSHFLEKLPIPNELKPGSKLQRVDTRTIQEKIPDHPDSKIPLWKRVIAIIRERQMGRLPFDTLAARSGFAEDDVRSWCNNVEFLAEMKTKSGKPRHLNGSTRRKNPDFRFPYMLREKESRKIAAIVLNVFETSSGRVKQDIIKGVRDFVACFSVGESGVPCQTYGSVNKWVRFMTSLNVPLQQIHVVRIQPKTARLEPASVQIKLAVRFGLPESSVTVRSLYPVEYSRAGAYCVQVKNSKIDKNGKLNGNYGFKFAMYMIAIIVGLE